MWQAVQKELMGTDKESGWRSKKGPAERRFCVGHMVWGTYSG